MSNSDELAKLEISVLKQEKSQLLDEIKLLRALLYDANSRIECRCNTPCLQNLVDQVKVLTKRDSK